MWCCGKQFIKDDGKYRNSVFDTKQIDSLKKKFNTISNNQEYITREIFKNNIGYLGIKASVSSFVDRIFNSFDIDGDNKISVDDFIQYMEILKDGSQDEKAQISFNLIYMNESMVNHDKNYMYPKRKYTQNSKNSGKINKIKTIDIEMFQRFFEDFYRSWSSLTNQVIPKQTRKAMKKFVQQLFLKVESDGYKNIDLNYYKILYKDKQFMMAFRQINNKLGNFFIKSNNQDFQKNIATMHKILKKINSIHSKTFPLKNDQFMKHPERKIKTQKINKYDNEQQLDEQLNIYRYDAKRYQLNNIYDDQELQPEIKVKQPSILIKVIQPSISIKGKQPSIPNKFRQVQKIVNQSQINQVIYQQRLSQHVTFLQRKLLFIQQHLSDIIQQSKQMFQQMHNQFLKILQKIQRKQHQQDIQIDQFNQELRKDRQLHYSLEDIQPHNKLNHNNVQDKRNTHLNAYHQNNKRDNSNLSGNNNNNRESPDNNRKSPYNNKESKDNKVTYDSKDKKHSKEHKHKKQNKKVFFGDKNFNLVLQIMVGIQMSVRSVSGFQEVIFEEPQDFNLKHTFQMDYGHFGQNDILYTFTDYAPNVFNNIRSMYQIENQQYINSIGPNRMMSALIMGRMASFQELVSEGKSGSFFYHTEDGKYLIKTISQKQFYKMRRLLEKYFRHLKQNPQTLMPRFFGLHKITSKTKKQSCFSNKMIYYLIVMNNFLKINQSKDKIVDKYDLKGSWVGRQNFVGSGVKKDLNFKKDNRKVNIDRDKKQQIFDIIQKDAEFFSQNEIIDYSLLLGFVQTKSNQIDRIKSMSMFQKQQAQSEPTLHILDQKKSMNFKFKSIGGQSQSYLIGIIDILTEYNTKKQAQHLFKGCIYDKKGISAVPPQQYKNRFLGFIRTEVFLLSEKIYKQIQLSKEKHQRIQKPQKVQNNYSMNNFNISNSFVSEKVQKINKK